MTVKSEELRDYFKTFDANGDGTISENDLKANLKDWPEHDVEDLFASIDKNQDGSVRYEEFTDWVMRAPEEATKVKTSSETYANMAQKFVDTGTVPTELFLEQAVSLKAALGPMLLEEELLRKQIQDLQTADKTLGQQDLGKRLYNLKALEPQVERLRQTIEAGKVQLDHLRIQSSRLVAPNLGDDRLAYEDVLTKLDPDGHRRAQVTQVAARMHNRGPLSTHQRVEVVHEGSLHAAEVLNVIGDGCYELSLWKEINAHGAKYEAGFDTSQPILGKYPRESIYANRKQFQLLADGRTDIPVDQAAFCLMLFRDAEKQLPKLASMSDRVTEKVNTRTGRTSVHAKNAPLKNRKRVMEKVAEKYRGNFSKVTDLVRNTYVCEDLEAVKLVLEIIGEDEAVEVVLVKNRLMPEFDASSTGGYRDILINLRDRATGHIMESQITVSGLLDIKESSGHASYDLVRVLGLAEKATTHHTGALSPHVITAIECGMLHSLECRGESRLGEHFTDLAEAMASATCLLESIKIVDDDNWPAGKTLGDLLTPTMLKAGAKRLRIIGISKMSVQGTIPNEIYGCTNLRTLFLQHLQIEGGLSPEVGNLMECRRLWLDNNSNLSGTIPAAIGKCAHLEHLQLNNTNVSGVIPKEIGECTKLKKLLLSDCNLSGEVPVLELTKLTNMTLLALDENPALQITESGRTALEKAMPSAHFYWPES